jgi:hypothetical protein
MTQPAKSQEPSMEEILASIRRIIADDDANKSGQNVAAAPKAEPPPAPPPPMEMPPPAAAAPQVPFSSEPDPFEAGSDADQSSDILDLTESMTAPMPAAEPPSPPPHAMPDPAPQFHTIDGSSDIGFEESPDRAAPRGQVHGGERGQLISNETSSAVDSAFNALAQTVLAQNARTIEDLVRDMLRPMLKTWLDDNLPGMVERLVRAEIERVSRGRTG